jgi:hypothetical protein
MTQRNPLPITPAQLAIGRPLNSVPDVQEDSLKKSSNKAIERYLYLTRLLNQYWGQKEYVHQLNLRSKWFKEEDSIHVGDIVMVSEDNVSRIKWLLAKVVEVHQGKDGLVRTATIKTPRGVLKRPVQRLHKLEIEASSRQEHQKRDFSPNGWETHVEAEQCCNKNMISVVPPSGGQGGEDVRAQYHTRAGRAVRPPRRYEM